MLIYSGTKNEFTDQILNNEIVETIQGFFVRETGHRNNNAGMIRSWENSLQRMNNVINDQSIPDNAGIAIEYRIPRTSKSIDFIISGYDNKNKGQVIIIELKQWEDASITDEDAMVETFTGNGRRKVVHPSYQAWSYASLLNDYNQTIQDNDIELQPCAYLHNYNPDDVILNSRYQEYIDRAPVFLRKDAEKLRDFIKRFIKKGDNGKLLYEIDNGKIRPSKHLIDSLSSMINGNKEFTLIDDQKGVFEAALSLAEKLDDNKSVLIVNGGPGTGKTIVAINLLVEFTKQQKLAQYVTKNAAPRAVFSAKLAGSMRKAQIDNMFTGSGQYIDIEKNSIDALIVDEAHRLNQKSGLYGNFGENQIKEIINAAKFSVFFLDEDQRVTLKDIGSREEIIKQAKALNSDISEMELLSQFRCNGSDGYLSWINNVLEIRSTANVDLEDLDYDFQVFDTPEELHSKIRIKNEINNKSRMVAGYCWNWNSKKDKNLFDIEIGDYTAKWNLTEHGSSWLIHPNSVSEVGCIHTCQGLELDFVGVIIGDDFIVRNGKVCTDHSKRAKTDQSLKGLSKIREEDPIYADAMADMIIKNTYRTLMTRGMKGCYIYCTDSETQEYFRNALKKKVDRNVGQIDDGIIEIWE